MKRILLIITVSLISGSVAKSQEKLSDEQKVVQQTVIKMFDALSNRDSVAIKNYCAADVQLFEYGMTWNLDTLISKAVTLNQSPDFKRVNTIDFISTTVEKGVAWTTYNNQAEITQNGKHRSIKWIETVILVRESDEWKIKVLHSTYLKNANR
jgi:ketosteroid isomerase-like protein